MVEYDEIIIMNTTSSGISLIDLDSKVLLPEAPIVLSDYYPNESISNSSMLRSYVSNGDIVLKTNSSYLKPSDAVEFLNSFTTMDNPKDRSGKPRVHQTSRKLGLGIHWVGVGDNPDIPSYVGGGECISVRHKVGDVEAVVKYIDFNCIDNETWLHEGYITWKDCDLDTLTLDIVPRVTSTITSSGTDYNIYGGYLVVPAISGTGLVDILSDITTHSGGLVYIPNDDLNNPPTAFWNADWNNSTHKFENISPAPLGDGRYNMFSAEVTMVRFINQIPLLASGFIALSSSDTEQLGHGMRIRLMADTNTDISDHSWSMASTICLHRARSV